METAFEVDVAMGRPACFKDERDWTEWVELALAQDPGPASYCRDCTPQYAAEARAAGLCEHPGTVFEFGPEGLEGRRLVSVAAELMLAVLDENHSQQLPCS